MAAAVGTQIRPSNGGVSRLSLMQARIRQQLMLEKESRLLEMAARQDAEREDIISRVTKTSASSLNSSMSSLNSSGAGQGRVRKMFEDRRIGGSRVIKGIDKSHPLEPVNRGPQRGGARNGRNTSVERSGGQDYNDGMTRSRSQVNMQRANRGDSRISRPPKGPTVTRNISHHKSTSSLMDNNHKNYRDISRGPSPGLPSSTKSSPGARAPAVAPIRRKPPPPRNNNTLRVNTNRNSKSRSSSPSPAPSPKVTENKGFFAKLGFGNKSKPESTPRAPKPPPRSNKLSVTNKENKYPSPAPSPRKIDPNLKQCKICGRGFAEDRIQKHEQICAKSKKSQKKRKPFDPVKMRTVGTEAEKFVARGDHLKENKKEKKNNWRKKHEDFVNTIRAAKGMKGYVAPPLDTSDYIDCPHCGRKFSEQVADRHIPKCASITSNKSQRQPNKAPPRRR